MKPSNNIAEYILEASKFNWEVVNTSLMDHPFHLHGFFFQAIEENGKAPAYKASKDTYNLKPKSKIKIAWVPDNRPGRWMYHCPILEHHAAGMMAHFEVVAPTIPRRSLKSTCTDAMHRTIYSSIIKLKTMETTKSKCTCSTICNCGDSCPGSNCTCGCNGCA